MADDSVPTKPKGIRGQEFCAFDLFDFEERLRTRGWGVDPRTGLTVIGRKWKTGELMEEFPVDG